MRRPELLAPAGGRGSLEAAVAAGADAVYFGLPEFSARARAENFTVEELPSVMDSLRARNVRGYVAMNTLLFPRELDRAAALLARVAEAGADAVIVQDLGLARLAREMAPSLPVHASTQMALSNGGAIALARESFGVERVILPRELSLEQVRRIRSETDADLEVFVHGSLCLSYGGQCLASASIGSRSGNRGSCAQPCRLPYTLGGRRGFPLSPLDLSAWELLCELVSMGVKGFKIEGRLKNSRYVGAATGFYRRALDAALEGRSFAPSEQDLLDLAQGFSRGFTKGWLGKVPRGSIVEGSGPESRGLAAGRVVRSAPSGVLIEPCLELKPGDGVAFGSGESRTGGRILKLIARGARRVELRLRSAPSPLQPGTEVRKTSDARPPRLWACPPRREALELEVRAPLGGALRIKAGSASGRQAEAVWETTLRRAERHPISPELLREHLGRLGDSPFALGKLSTPVLDPVLVPKSVLNRLRRELLAELLKPKALACDADALARLRSKVLPMPSRQPPELRVLVRTPEQLQAALGSGCSLSRIYCDFQDLDSVPAGAAVAGPRVLEPGDESVLEALERIAPPAILVRNLATLPLLAGSKAELVADWRLNASNPLSVQTLLDMGFSRVTPAYDLDPEGLDDLLRRCGGSRFEALAYQHVEMFHTKHCFHSAAFLSGRECPSCPTRCAAPVLRLKDRKGVAHPIVPDGLGRSTVFHGKPESRPMDPRCASLRVEFLHEGPEQVPALLERFSRALSRARR
jgi:putative protease